MGKPRPTPSNKPKSKPRSALAKSVPKFSEAFALTAVAAMALYAATRFGWLDAWQWESSRGPSIYVAAGAGAGLLALALAWRSGKAAFWGAALAILGALALLVAFPL